MPRYHRRADLDGHIRAQAVLREAASRARARGDATPSPCPDPDEDVTLEEETVEEETLLEEQSRGEPTPPPTVVEETQPATEVAFPLFPDIIPSAGREITRKEFFARHEKSAAAQRANGWPANLIASAQSAWQAWRKLTPHERGVVTRNGAD